MYPYRYARLHSMINTYCMYLNFDHINFFFFAKRERKRRLTIIIPTGLTGYKSSRCLLYILVGTSYGHVCGDWRGKTFLPTPHPGAPWAFLNQQLLDNLSAEGREATTTRSRRAIFPLSRLPFPQDSYATFTNSFADTDNI